MKIQFLVSYFLFPCIIRSGVIKQNFNNNGSLELWSQCFIGFHKNQHIYSDYNILVQIEFI